MTRVAIAVAMVAVGGCQPEHTVVVDLGLDGTPLGISCRDPNTNAPLIAAAITGDELQLALVFDLLAVGPSVPSCRVEKLRQACDERTADGVDAGCPPLATQRRCIDVHAQGVTGSQAARLLRVRSEVQAALATSAPLTADAPDAPVVVRAIAVAGNCDSIDLAAMLPTVLAEQDIGRVVGCMSSCPVHLDDVDLLEMSLDGEPETCTTAIRSCVKHWTTPPTPE